ncbi:uncharacterized protein LOC119110471 isoform X2 [Pollicipes pollicipes]|uniref:uncharacterized protein LOC119110471 isoform X2 n=1 Tax=Pollicipes pollicipes TaxID=41117 RepID=UPI0018850CF9|nr:uncharacterized protein LOC119110471 isoform X2 [Pollicipes pollicipes]
MPSYRRKQRKLAQARARQKQHNSSSCPVTSQPGKPVSAETAASGERDKAEDTISTSSSPSKIDAFHYSPTSGTSDYFLFQRLRFYVLQEHSYGRRAKLGRIRMSDMAAREEPFLHPVELSCGVFAATAQPLENDDDGHRFPDESMVLRALHTGQFMRCVDAHEYVKSMVLAEINFWTEAVAEGTPVLPTIQNLYLASMKKIFDMSASDKIERLAMLDRSCTADALFRLAMLATPESLPIVTDLQRRMSGCLERAYDLFLFCSEFTEPPALPTYCSDTEDENGTDEREQASGDEKSSNASSPMGESPGSLFLSDDCSWSQDETPFGDDEPWPLARSTQDPIIVSTLVRTLMSPVMTPQPTQPPLFGVASGQSLTLPVFPPLTDAEALDAVSGNETELKELPSAAKKKKKKKKNKSKTPVEVNKNQVEVKEEEGHGLPGADNQSNSKPLKESSAVNNGTGLEHLGSSRKCGDYNRDQSRPGPPKRAPEKSDTIRETTVGLEPNRTSTEQAEDSSGKAITEDSTVHHLPFANGASKDESLYTSGAGINSGVVKGVLHERKPDACDPCDERIVHRVRRQSGVADEVASPQQIPACGDRLEVTATVLTTADIVSNGMKALNGAAAPFTERKKKKGSGKSTERTTVTQVDGQTGANADAKETTSMKKEDKAKTLHNKYASARAVVRRSRMSSIVSRIPETENQMEPLKNATVTDTRVHAEKSEDDPAHDPLQPSTEHQQGVDVVEDAPRATGRKEALSSARISTVHAQPPTPHPCEPRVSASPARSSRSPDRSPATSSVSRQLSPFERSSNMLKKTSAAEGSGGRPSPQAVSEIAPAGRTDSLPASEDDMSPPTIFGGAEGPLMPTEGLVLAGKQYTLSAIPEERNPQALVVKKTELACGAGEVNLSKTEEVVYGDVSGASQSLLTPETTPPTKVVGETAWCTTKVALLDDNCFATRKKDAVKANKEAYDLKTAFTEYEDGNITDISVKEDEEIDPTNEIVEKHIDESIPLKEAAHENEEEIGHQKVATRGECEESSPRKAAALFAAKTVSVAQLEAQLKTELEAQLKAELKAERDAERQAEREYEARLHLAETCVLSVRGRSGEETRRGELCGRGSVSSNSQAEPVSSDESLKYDSFYSLNSTVSTFMQGLTQVENEYEPEEDDIAYKESMEGDDAREKPPDGNVSGGCSESIERHNDIGSHDPSGRGDQGDAGQQATERILAGEGDVDMPFGLPQEPVIPPVNSERSIVEAPSLRHEQRNGQRLASALAGVFSKKRAQRKTQLSKMSSKLRQKDGALNTCCCQ